MSAATLESVIDGLQRDGRLPDGSVEQARALVAKLRAAPPWYIRLMVGFGAWLASLLLIGFVFGLGLALGDSTVIGLVLVVAATWVRRREGVDGNDFVVQCTLATSLAGQALFGWGLADLLPGDEVKTGAAIVVVMSAAMFLLFPDRIHRVLMVLLATTCAMMLVYAFELNAVVPVAGPLLAAALIVIYRSRASFTVAGHGDLIRPLAHGLMLSAFGCLLLSAVYVLPDLGAKMTFYPRPWISTLLLGALLLGVIRSTWTPLFECGAKLAAPLAYVLALAVIAAAWNMPGLLLALIVVLLGAGAGHRTFVGAGIAFLVAFVGAWFYGIEVTLLAKSIALAGSGVLILLARRVLLSTLEAPGHA